MIPMSLLVNGEVNGRDTGHRWLERKNSSGITGERLGHTTGVDPELGFTQLYIFLYIKTIYIYIYYSNYYSIFICRRCSFVH